MERFIHDAWLDSPDKQPQLLVVPGAAPAPRSSRTWCR